MTDSYARLEQLGTRSLIKTQTLIAVASKALYVYCYLCAFAVIKGVAGSAG